MSRRFTPNVDVAAGRKLALLALVITLVLFAVLSFTSCAPVTHIAFFENGKPKTVTHHDGILWDADIAAAEIMLPGGIAVRTLAKKPSGTKVAKAAIAAGVTKGLSRDTNATAQLRDSNKTRLGSERIAADRDVKLGEQAGKTNSEAMNNGLFTPEATTFQQK